MCSGPGSPDVDIAALKEGTRALWSAGNYPEIARLIEPAARELVDACAISAGQEVLDVAAGTGNVAVLAAREGAQVVASDLTPALIEQGRARSAAEGLEIEWVEADVEDLPFEDERFDCVTSSFGAMFAPRPELAASEMFRVLRPGGTLGMASWTPEGFQGRLFTLQNEHLPRAEGVPPPVEWGQEDIVRSRLDGLAARLEVSWRSVHFSYESEQAMWEFFTENAGPAVVARKALPPERFEALSRDALRLVGEWNRAGDGSVAIDSEYLLVVAHKPG